jgi:hypothetical protein
LTDEQLKYWTEHVQEARRCGGGFDPDRPYENAVVAVAIRLVAVEAELAALEAPPDPEADRRAMELAFDTWLKFSGWTKWEGVHPDYTQTTEFRTFGQAFFAGLAHARQGRPDDAR